MYFYCHASTLPLCYENNENWPKNYSYFKELPFLITNFVRSDVITNSPKMLTKQKKTRQIWISTITVDSWVMQSDYFNQPVGIARSQTVDFAEKKKSTS